MTLILLQDRIDFPDLSDNLSTQINVIDDDDREGCVWLTLPKNTVKFGKNFKIPVVRSKYQPFLEGIKYLYQPFIEKTLLDFKDIVEGECNVANKIFPKLEKIKNEHSRWGFYTYIANLNSYPFIIENQAKVVILDKKTGVFSESCELIFVAEDDEDGHLYMKRAAKMPFVLQGGSGTLLGFLTNNMQIEMKFGQAIREAFNRGQATCYIQINLRKVGLFKKQLFKSSGVRP